MARILDPKLLSKLAAKLDKSEQYVRETISRFANKEGIASEVALIVLAKREGIGTALYQRSLDPAKQSQVRDALAITMVVEKPRPAKAGGKVPRRTAPSQKAVLSNAIEYLVRDPILLARCRNLLLAPRNFDIAINQATLILEDRIRTKSESPKKMTGEPLVGFAFNEDVGKTRLRVESGDADDQRGFTQILRGIVPAFRNKTHHHIVDTLSREEAMRVVGFIDVLLGIVDKTSRAYGAGGRT